MSLQGGSQRILTATLSGRYYYPHFTSQETDSEILSHLSKVTKLVKGRTMIGALVCLIPKRKSCFSEHEVLIERGLQRYRFNWEAESSPILLTSSCDQN